LSKQGNNYLRIGDPRVQPSAPAGLSVEQGQLEASNTGSAESAVRLVNVMRQFEMLQKAAQLGNDMSRQAIAQVARVGSYEIVMIRALSSAASGMTAQQLNVDTTAHNLANANTTGFKTRRAQFQDLLYQSVVQPGAASGQQTVVPTGLQLGLGPRASS